MGLIIAGTNIIIYIMNGLPAVERHLDAEFALSEISEIELLDVKGIGTRDLQIRQKMINECFLLNINDSIKRIAMQLKQKYTSKTPDVLIAATAIYHRPSLLSADKGFAWIKELNLTLLNI